jgi:hypothetical protein
LKLAVRQECNFPSIRAGSGSCYDPAAMRGSLPGRPAIRHVFLALFALAGCSGGEDAAGGGGGSQGEARTYDVRGQVVVLPGPQNPGGLNLTHEPVDDWVDHEGKVTGMDPMNMTFPLAEGVDLDGIQVGDVVEFTLRADWKADRPVEIIRVRELPPGTQLHFRAAEPPADRSGN